MKNVAWQGYVKKTIIKFQYKFMHMMISIVVNKACVECIERTREIKRIRDSEVSRAIFRQEQGTMSNATNG